MGIDIEEELRQFLEGMKSLRNLERFTKGTCCDYHCCDKEEDDECEIAASLEEDYKLFTLWAFGCENPGEMSKRSAKKAWEEKHPKIPVPRVLLTKVKLPSDISTVCLFMDAFPYYLETKRKCAG